MKKTKRKSGSKVATTCKVNAVSDARAAQLINDASEGIESGTLEEWRVVALHQSRQVGELLQNQLAMLSCLKLRRIGRDMQAASDRDLDAWLDKSEKLNSTKTE